MSVLWAFVALVSIHIGGVDGTPSLFLSSNPLVPEFLQSERSNILSLPRSNQKLLNPLVPLAVPKVPLLPMKKSNKDTTETSEPHCAASVWSSTSEEKMNNYLNSSITEAIKGLFKCSEISLGGLLKPVLSLVDLESILKKDGPPGMGSLPLPTDGLSGLLNKPTSSLPLPTDALSGLLNNPTSSLPVPTGTLLDLLKLQSSGDMADSTSSSFLKGNGQMLNNGELSNVASENGLSLKDKSAENLVPLSLTGNKNAKESKESDKSGDPASSGAKEIAGKGLDVMKDKLEDLKLHATNIVIKNITTKMEGSFMDVTAYVSADISGPPSLTGLLVQIMGFQMDGIAKIKVGVAANDSICAKFVSEEKSIQVEKMNVKLLDVIKNEEKCIPLPLSPLVSGLVTLEMKFSKEECPIDLPNPWCNNATVPDKQDLFKYTLKSCNFTSAGLVCAYCAEINYNEKSVPVAGGQAPKLPADAAMVLAFHHHLVKAAITHTMKKISVKTNDTALQIMAVKYKLNDPKLDLYLYEDVKQNGIKIAEIQSTLMFLVNGVIDDRHHLSGSMNLQSSENKIEPENDTAKELAKQMIMKVVAQLNDDLNHMNIPISPMSDSLKGSAVHADAQGNLITSQ